MDKSLLFIVASTAIVSFKGFSDKVFFDKYKFQMQRIQNGEIYRMLSSGFLHADFSHLFFNMFTLFVFSPVVTGYFNSVIYLLIYFASMLVGSVLTLQLHKNEPWYSAIGASGAVTGIVYAAILIQPEMSLYLFFIPIPIPAYIFGILYLLYSIYGMRKQNDGIGHTAHFGGAIGGLAITALVDYHLLLTHYKITLLLLVPIVLLFVLQRNKNLR